MGPLFVIATDLSPHDAAWRQAAAEADAIAELTAPILGFRPEIVLAGSTLGELLAREAAQGRTLAFVLPAILDFSVFQRQALVEIVRESQRSAPALAVHYDDVDPCHRLVVQAFADALCDRLAGSEVPPARLGVVAVASGQGDARARAEAYAMMRLLWEQLNLYMTPLVAAATVVILCITMLMLFLAASIARRSEAKQADGSS